jgi:hypothetical protein
MGSFAAKGAILPPHATSFKNHTNPDGSSDSSISQQDLETVVSKIKKVFVPIVDQHGGKLRIETYWEDQTINLYAEQVSFSWFIHVFGGFVRLPHLSLDALTMAICHELGHHLAGFPFKTTWSTAEAQADYFANHVCTHQLWQNDLEVNLDHAERIDPNSHARCLGAYEDLPNQALCFRKATAALNLSQVMAKVLNEPEIDPNSRPQERVAKTLYEHPNTSCRFETFVRAALCPKPFDLYKIPGRIPRKIVPVPSPPRGSNELWAEQESAKFLCVFDGDLVSEFLGARPECWFASRL